MRFVIALPAVLFSFIAAVGLFFTQKTARDPNNARFSTGRVPDPLPDGLHQGFVDGYSGSWKGKSFDAATASGINLFEGPGGYRRAYPFSTYVARGLQDRDRDVLKIDYNIPGNPPWVRPILDEIVEIEPGRYLGKVHVRLLPRLPFTVAYFELQRQEAPAPPAAQESAGRPAEAPSA